MKKTVAIIGMLMMIDLIASSIDDFNQADNAIIMSLAEVQAIETTDAEGVA